jgi:N-6 DNA Methylase/Eco57I restriction-modification methylase
MLPGFAGHLLSESFLEEKLTSDGATPERTAAWRRFGDAWRRSQSLGPASSLRAMLGLGAAPLTGVMGFAPPRDVALDRAALVATVDAGGEPVVLIVAPWCEPLERLWRAGVTHAIHRSTRWCALFNGISLRLVDAARPHSRRYTQFDLDTVADDECSFAAFAFVLSRLPSALDALVQESDRHGAGVCRSLKDGVLSASADMLTALVRPVRARRASWPADSFEQALTIVYRILFLLFAESRRLVPLWHPVYRDSYSIEALASLAERSDTRGLWDVLRAIARLAHAGCRAGDLHVTPFNGRLFAPGRTPLAERRDLDDEAARRALLALSTRPSADRGGRQKIAYRDLGVEQLGAVYETLLDYQPQLTSDGVSLLAGSGVRKSTGTFYTPQPIADYLVRRTLSPLVEEAPPHRILDLRIVDPAMGSGAFLVAACRYLAQAYEAALIRHDGCHPGDIGDEERAAIRRTIAGRCLYGVDLNPMAVQLARLSLWLATLSADRPLTFLDHRLQTGDSLLGAWLDCLRRVPAPSRRSKRRDDTTYDLFDRAALHGALADALPVRFSIESLPGDTIDHVRQKEAALSALRQPGTALSRWKQIADVWCACWFSSGEARVPPEAFSSVCDFILSGRSALPARSARKYLELTGEAASTHRFFHWEVEFPEVFFDASGHRRARAGFDAVIGNPPWDMIRADAGSTDTRRHARASNAPVLRFTRDAGVYVTQSTGHANRYQLFAERALALARHGGRIGLVLPSGLATDQGSAALRRRLIAECDVDALVGLDNRRGVFPIHRSVKFLLVTATTGSPTGSIACRLGESDPAALEADDGGSTATSAWFPVRLTPDLIRRLSGDGLAIPDLRAAVDVAIAERAAALFPPLGSDAGWSARFGRELNATDDRHAFEHAGVGELPIVEGKQVEPFRARLDATEHSIHASKARRLLKPSRYEHPRLAYRDVASATNRVTLIAAVLPARCVSTHTLFCLRSTLPIAAHHFLCGLFNSFVVNYLVRMRVTTHVTTATVERLPIPPPGYAPSVEREIAALARLLSRRDDPIAFTHLQALAAGLYQLTADEFRHVLTTFPLVPGEIREAAYATYVATEAQRTRR